MALTSSEVAGFQSHRKIDCDTIFWVAGDPGVTFAKGDKINMEAGVAALAAADDASFGTVVQSVTCPANTTAFPVPAGHIVNRQTATPQFSALVPIRLDVSGTVQTEKCLFKNHMDDTVTSYTAGTRTIVHAGTALGTDDEGISGLLYVYEGPGKGEVNVVEDYTTSSKSIVCHRPFNATLTTASKFIILGTVGASAGVGQLSRIELADEDELDVTNGTDDGNYQVVLDWREAAEMLNKLQLPVAPAKALTL